MRKIVIRKNDVQVEGVVCKSGKTSMSTDECVAEAQKLNEKKNEPPTLTTFLVDSDKIVDYFE